jgi:hypothetical protein
MNSLAFYSSRGKPSSNEEILSNSAHAEHPSWAAKVVVTPNTTPPPGFLLKLYRRKVVQWGVAYIAGSWGFLQGFEYASSTFGWLPHLQQLLTLAFVVLLPIVLVLSWYHGDKGHQHVTSAELTILTALFLLGGTLFWNYEQQTESSQAEVDFPNLPVAEAGLVSFISESPDGYAVLVAENSALRLQLSRVESELHEARTLRYSRRVHLPAKCTSSD